MFMVNLYCNPAVLRQFKAKFSRFSKFIAQSRRFGQIIANLKHKPAIFWQIIAIYDKIRLFMVILWLTSVKFLPKSGRF